MMMTDVSAGTRKGSYSEVLEDDNGSLPTNFSSGGGNSRISLISLRQLILCAKVSVPVIVSFLVGLYLGGQSSEITGTALGNAKGRGGAILVTGATGRTGSLLYHELKRRGANDVRAFVRNVTKAKSVLGCVKCDETEGIYIGDVTEPITLDRAMSDGSVTTLAIAIGGSFHDTAEMRRKIHFDSVVYSVKTLAWAHKERKDLGVVLCSSMGTNQPPQDQASGFKDILHWKLNSEAFLSTSAIPNTVIVKPCGLPVGMAGNSSTLLVGHNGTIMEGTTHHSVSREDVARVMAESVMMPNEYGKSTNLRFDLCSQPGPTTTDLKGLIDSARWKWDQ